MLYDMVLHIKAIKVDEAVELILQSRQAAGLRTPRPRPSKSSMTETLAARVQAALVEEFPTARVCSRGTGTSSWISRPT